MSSLIGDPFWNAAAWTAREVRCMSSGDIAAWMQFFGAMGAIGFAWWQAGKDGRIREQEAEATAERESRQRVINYEIAEDLFRLIVEQRFKASVAVWNSRASEYFEGETLEYIDASLKMLDSLVVSPLPGKDSAIDVQQMRHYAFMSRARFVLAQNHYKSGSEELCLPTLLNNLDIHVNYAYRSRDANGPVKRDDLENHNRWRAEKKPDLQTLAKAYQKAGLDIPMSR